MKIFLVFCINKSVFSNTDKMTDEEKIPIALVGLVGISLPFILGLIALYAARY
jgi:hypothetical protein